MGRSYKKVPIVKNKEVVRVYRDKTLNAIFSCKNFKEMVKKEYGEYEKKRLSKLVSTNRNS